MLRTSIPLAAALALMIVAGPASAQGAGPALTVAPAALERSLVCEGDLAAKAPVLLVHGTAEEPKFFAWNYVRALRARSVPFCTVAQPDKGLGDVQVAAEYVVHAIRTMHGRAGGRKVSIIGHSQGGMNPRWALKYWPDTRLMVDDLVGLASSNHGTTSARSVCGGGSCSPSVWQQRDDSNFLKALNTGPETFAGISYTSVFTRYDQIVLPNNDAATGSTALRTGDGRRANVLVQELCPANTSEHLALGSSDPVGYALAIDALTHDGPADPARVDRAACAQLAHEGVDPATYAATGPPAYAEVIANFAAGPQVRAEPPLRCYAGGPCAPGEAAPGGSAASKPLLRISVSPGKVRARRAVRVRILVRRLVNGKLKPVRGARVLVAGVRVTTDRNGRATARKRFGFERVRRYRVRASGPGFRAGSGVLRSVR